MTMSHSCVYRTIHPLSNPSVTSFHHVGVFILCFFVHIQYDEINQVFQLKYYCFVYAVVSHKYSRLLIKNITYITGFFCLFQNPCSSTFVVVTMKCLVFVLSAMAVAAAASDSEDSKKRAECDMWSKLENKTLPLQNQGHANCTTNPDCTGFSCKGIYQVRHTYTSHN